MPHRPPPPRLAVVTGSTGFIGSHLVDALRARGTTVRVLVRPETRRDRLPDGVEAHALDLHATRDDALAAHSVWDGVTQVFHIGGRIGAVRARQFHEGNVITTARLTAALAHRARADGVAPHLILASSLAAHGPAPSRTQPVRETDPPAPVDAYGQSKRAAELAALAHQDTVPVTIVRPSAVYGPRDRGFLAVFRQVAGAVPIHAVPPHHALSLVHVDDVIAALLAAAQPAAHGRAYFVAHPDPLTWGTLYDTVARVMRRTPDGTLLRTVTVPRPVLSLAALAGDAYGLLTGRTPLINSHKRALATPPWWVCDVSRLTTELGWRATVAHEDGLRDTAAWYRAQGWVA